jgi:guanine deaminase
VTRHAYRACLFHLLDMPVPGETPEGWHDDGVLVVEDGVVLEAGAWADIGPRLPDATSITHFPDALIVPGFVDAHVHYPQIDVMASPGAQLMDWLENYTFPAEARFADSALANETAEFFLDQLLRHGTTAALVFATVHAGSVEALFTAAQRRNMCIASGKVLMDRNAPDELCDTAESGARESQALIDAWHGKGRLRYAVTPRFAPTSSDEQLALAGKLLADNPGVLLHTHMSENHGEIAAVHDLFPDCADYLAVYEKYGLATDRTVLAHCLHLSQSEWQRLGACGCSIAFCPTSNLFLGSGLFNLAAADQAGINVALGTDVGAGTSLSLLETMNEAYKVAHLREDAPDPLRLFHLATLGGAKALKLENRIGNFAPGKDADFLVLDRAATPLLARRMKSARTPAEQLFAFAMMGDDRAVAHTYIAGTCAYSRA